MTPDVLFTLAKNIGPSLGYEDVVDFVTLYKSDPEKFFTQLFHFWAVRGHELEAVFGYTLFFQHTWCIKEGPKTEGENNIQLEADLIICGVQMGGLARGAPTNLYG